MNWEQILMPLLGTIATAVGVAITYFVKKLVDYLIAKMEANETEKQAFQLLLDGMAKAEDDLVRQAKLAAEDGKLSEEEIAQARQIAYDYAISAAKGPVLDIVKSWGMRRASALISQLLSKLNTTTKVA